MNLESTVSNIKSIGEQRAKKLNKMGIVTVADLISHYPKQYQDRCEVRAISDLVQNEENTFSGKVRGKPENIRMRRLMVTRVCIEDPSGIVYALWYNQPYMKNTFKPNCEYIFTGIVQKKGARLEVATPEFEPASNETLSAGRITPVYPLTEGLSQKLLRTFIKRVLDDTEIVIEDALPQWICKKYRLCDKNNAVRNIHFPKDQESFFLARRRLVFEELFLLQLSLLRIKGDYKNKRPGIVFKYPQVCRKLLAQFPFSLTQGQKKVIKEIFADLMGGSSMNRLVQGDVGSGKTALAMLACFFAIQNGYQAVLMAPTEVLATQHMESFCSAFSGFGIQTVLLNGTLKKKERVDALEQIESGRAQMVIGTHAVIQDAVHFQRLGLVITDEQHRFGVRQREKLSEKGEGVHILVMTATPIPRTLALILYGDLDISIVDGLPPGRQKIETIAVTPAYRERLHAFIKKEVEQNRQAYIICPMIEENDKLELEDVLSYTEKLQEEALLGISVACLHGKMKANEKEDIMGRFKRNEIQVLVCTTVIEVGINVQNATVMAVENAERFGLAQLHQLRGRVGRGSQKSYCILICASKSKVSRQRMRVMANSDDGFVISEEDLRIRGPGDFFGTRQHGLPELKIANLYEDMEILKLAQEAAHSLMEKDILLANSCHRLLCIQLDRALERDFIPL